jgi:hypothetical protein
MKKLATPCPVFGGGDIAFSSAPDQPRRKLRGWTVGPMRNLLLPAAAVLVCGIAAGQTDATEPRERPVPSSRGGSNPTPADPSGVYTGVVQLTVSGYSTVPQIWRIDLQSRACPECVPGQYFLSGTNFSGVDFGAGLVERGGVRGSVNPNGEAVDLSLLTVNCLFINPSGATGDAPYSGRTRGGSFGESADQPLRVENGSMSGRVSGRDCFGRAVTADVSLQRQSAPVPPACDSIAGSYSASYASSAGASGGGSVTILQTGCFFAAYLPGMGGQLEGMMTGPTSAAIHISDPCAAPVHTGTMAINGTTINATYSGSATGGAGCPAGPVSGSFVLTHN